MVELITYRRGKEKSMELPDANLNPERSARVSGMALASRIRSFLAQPRLIFNSLFIFIFSAAWIRELLHWFHTDAFGTTLNYWAYTDWLIDYSQGFIRRGLSGEIGRLVPAALPRLEFVALLSWFLVLAAAFGYVRLLARPGKRCIH